MQLKFFTFIIRTIFVGLVSGRQLFAFNNPGNGGGYPYQQGNGGGVPQRNPPPYNSMNPQQPNNNGRNNPMNPANQYPPPQQPNNNGRNNPVNQPPQYPNNNGRNPMHPQQPPHYPNNNRRNNPRRPQQRPPYPHNNGRNNPMNHPNQYQPTQYPNNGERNNPMNPANQYQPPQPPNNNARNNPPIPGQQQPHRQIPNNYPPRPNMRRRNPNARPGFPKRPNGKNRRPQPETTQASTVPITIPLEYPKEDFPPGFIEDMLQTLGLSVVPQSEEPTENSLPPSTISETQPPMRNPHNRRPYQGPFGRRPGHRRKPTVATTANPLVLSETPFADEIIAQVEENYVFPTETISEDVAKATPVVPDAVISETTAEKNPELVTAPQAIESSTQSSASTTDEIKDSDNEISSDIYETSTPEMITKSELEPVITTETTTDKIATAEIVSASSALGETEIIEIMHVHAPEAETIPDVITSSPTDIPDHSEKIKTYDQPTTESPEANKDKSEYTPATQTSVAEDKTTSESITSSLLPATPELSNEITKVPLTSSNAEESTQAQIRDSEATQATQIPLATTTFSTTINEITSVSSSAAITPSQSSSEESDILDIKPGDSEFMPVFTKSPSEDEIVSTRESLPKTTCYCTDGVTFVTTESLINIKKATTPIFTIEEAHTKYSEVSNIGVTTPSYTSAATPKKMEENAVTLDTMVNSGRTQEDSYTDATTPNTEDLVLTTAPTIHSTVSAVTSTASSIEIVAEPSDQTTEYKDENHTDDEDENLHELMSAIFDENYYATEIPPPGVSCRENESYYKCIPNCRHACFNYDNFDVPCPRFCRPGCSCNPGFVINENNKCVKISECKDCMEIDVLMLICGLETLRNILYWSSAYREHRDSLFKEARWPGVNLPSGCCTDTCKDDEDWWECMPKNHNTCDNFARAEAKRDFVCESGCFCMEGLIQAPDGSCVKPHECPKPVCDHDPNEVETECLNACNTCGAMCEKPNFCSVTECRPGCDCLGGFKRDANGTCIRVLECPVCTTPPPSTTTTTIKTATARPKGRNTTPAQVVETTPVQVVETTPAHVVETTPAQKIETTAAQEVETTAAQDVETTAAQKVETTAAQEGETTPAPSKAETTPAPSKAETTPAPLKAETTPAPLKAETTSAPSKAETTQALSKAETTQAPSKTETTQAPSKAETTTPTAVDSTTLSESEETAQTSTPVETTAEVPLSTTD